MLIRLYQPGLLNVHISKDNFQWIMKYKKINRKKITYTKIFNFLCLWGYSGTRKYFIRAQISTKISQFLVQRLGLSRFFLKKLRKFKLNFNQFHDIIHNIYKKRYCTLLRPFIFRKHSRLVSYRKEFYKGSLSKRFYKLLIINRIEVNDRLIPLVGLIDFFIYYKSLYRYKIIKINMLDWARTSIYLSDSIKQILKVITLAKSRVLKRQILTLFFHVKNCKYQVSQKKLIWRKSKNLWLGGVFSKLQQTKSFYKKRQQNNQFIIKKFQRIFFYHYYVQYLGYLLLLNKKLIIFGQNKQRIKAYIRFQFGFYTNRKLLYAFSHKLEKFIYKRYPYKRQKYRLLYLFPRFANHRHLFKNQIREQHLFRWLYRLTYKQLVNMFVKTVKYSKRKFEYLFFKYLEFRIDLCLYRLNIVFSYRQSRQWIKRQLFCVNNKVINWPKYQINIGDIIIPQSILRLQQIPNNLWTNDYGYIYTSIRLFWRPIQKDQYPNYFIINERVPVGLILINPDPFNIYVTKPYSIQFLTISLLKYS